MLEKEFAKVTDNLVITTDDGSYKNKGFAIDYLIKDMKKEKYDCLGRIFPSFFLYVVYEI